MVSPHPPLSDSERAALTSARGTFREALAALRNVTSLARSRNVGPKAMLDVLSDVRAGSRGLGQALDDLLKASETGAVPVEDLLTLEAALERLESVDARAAQIVTLRFYSGMSNPEIAEHLVLSLRTVEGDWTFARAWL